MGTVPTHTAVTAVVLVVATAGMLIVSGCGGSNGHALAVTNYAGVAAPNTGMAAPPLSVHDGVLPVDRDGDNDNPIKSNRDNDDKPPLPGGKPPSGSERRAITALLKGYYAAAAATDGASACSGLYSAMRHAVPGDYGRPPGPPKLRGATCAVVLSKWFANKRQELQVKNATLKVRYMLVKHDRGVAILRFGAAVERFEVGRERRVTLHRENGIWKKAELFDVPAVG